MGRPKQFIELLGRPALYYTLQADWMYQDPMRNVLFLDNHDVSRFYSVIGEDLQKYKMGVAWLLTCRGIPQLYYGTEVLMKNFSNPDGKVREDFPGGWPGDKKNLFVAAGRNAQQWLAEERIWLAMIEDRNRTSHTYREELAKEIHARLPAYLAAMRVALAQIPTD